MDASGVCQDHFHRHRRAPGNSEKRAALEGSRGRRAIGHNPGSMERPRWRQVSAFLFRGGQSRGGGGGYRRRPPDHQRQRYGLGVRPRRVMATALPLASPSPLERESPLKGISRFESRTPKRPEPSPSPPREERVGERRPILLQSLRGSWGIP